MSGLSVRLRHRFGPEGAALDIAFEAGPGVTALFGRSGAGKTSVVRAVAGLFTPDAGRIALGGRVLTDSATGLRVPPHRRRVGYVFQEPRLFPHRDVAGNIAYGAPRRQSAARREAVIALLGLGPLLARRPATLSGGEAQRVAIARALLSEPEILLMDEPLASLDAARKAQVLPFIEALSAAGVPILYVSHDIGEVARLAETLVLIDAGRVVAAGAATALFADPALAPHLGAQNAGAMLPATLARADAGDGLSEVAVPGARLLVPAIEAPVGARLRLRIPATDVMLARTRPEGLSALNILAVTVDAVEDGRGPGVMVRLALPGGGAHLLARITRRSATALGVVPGAAMHAILKTVSVAPAAIGTRPLASPPTAPLTSPPGGVAEGDQTDFTKDPTP